MDWVKILIDAGRAAVGVPAAAYAISAMGLNLQFGYTGLLNFGHVGSMLVGAYGMAITVDRGGSLWLGVIRWHCVCADPRSAAWNPDAATSGRLPRDRDDCGRRDLADWLHARRGLPLSPRASLASRQFADEFFDLNPIPVGLYGIGRFRFDERTVWVMMLGWGTVAIIALFMWKLTRSPWGRAIRAIREDEDAALSLGKNVFGYKLQSLMVGGAIGALAGMYLAIDQQNVTPDTYLPLLTFYAFTIVILGGPGTLLGPITGSMIFWFLFEFLDGVMTGLIVEMEASVDL